MTYWYLTTDTVPFYVSIWSLKGTENYRFYGAVFGIVGAVHGARVLDLIVMSIRGRQLRLRSETSMIRTLMSNPMISRTLSLVAKKEAKDSQSVRHPKPRLATLVARSLGRMWKRVFSRQSFFGVESEHFSTVYALQEILVISSQTYQSYRASNLLPRPELNVIMVALLVTNCWTTASIQIFLRKSPELGRVFTFTYNAMVGFGMMTIVPLLIFIPCIEGFDLQYKYLKNQNFIFEPLTLVTLVLENRLIFAAGLFDFATKLIPHLSIMLSLVTVSELLGRGDVKVVPVLGVQFSHSNIKTVPNDLYLRWHPLVGIYFDYGELTDIPFQMFLSPAHVLSFVGNQIETIPTLAMLPAGAIIPELALSTNPLKEFPATLMEPTALIMSMNVQHTSLTSMPEWVKTNTKVVWAYGTPFCAAPMTDPKFADRVMCFERPAGQDLAFPIALLDALYPY
ncbi:hypothetical protein PR001_g15647 [Phytophthora rubi]|uniref:Uncharacterized protein n=1 Tax=Phytophthora rubi TaxID=129364 RepID=A0A6A3L0G4_9STRA|nr:hypothetical protein PR001_g15647 [Phytophthora rubi]